MKSYLKCENTKANKFIALFPTTGLVRGRGSDLNTGVPNSLACPTASRSVLSGQHGETEKVVSGGGTQFRVFGGIQWAGVCGWAGGSCRVGCGGWEPVRLGHRVLVIPWDADVDGPSWQFFMSAWSLRALVGLLRGF